MFWDLILFITTAGMLEGIEEVCVASSFVVGPLSRLEDELFSVVLGVLNGLIHMAGRRMENTISR